MCRLNGLILLLFLGSWLSAAQLTILSALEQPKFVNKLNVPPKIYPLLQGGVVNITMLPVNQSLGLYATNKTPVLTPVWGYNGMYPGPTIITPNDTNVVVIWQNSLPDTHIFKEALDPRVDCGPRFRFGVFEDINNCTNPEVRTVVHLHGARVDHLYDGYPEAWYDNTNGLRFHGASWDGYRPFSGIVYNYTNGQEAATLWYHDHAVGITRLNVYAGLSGFYLIQDKWERSLGLPDGDYDIPLIIQDKDFKLSGELYYPFSITDNLPQIQNFGLPLLPFILVNGGIWPYLEVRPTKYRFRLLNGCDTRFLNLSLTHNVPTWKIGADQGLLDTPIPMDLTDYSQINLFFGPAERIELVLDFSNFQNQDINFTNGGNYVFDYLQATNKSAFIEDLKTASLIMQFKVRGDPIPSNPLPSRLREDDFHIEVTPNNQTRYKAISVTTNPLNHVINHTTMLVLGHWNISDNKSVPWGFIPFMWNDTVSDFETYNVTTDWWICKTGGGIHPIHIHWLEFEVIARYYFNNSVDPIYGSGIGPQLKLRHYDEGPKDVIQAHPDECVQVRLLFKTRGRFIWHCHILSHEDLDMMRPLLITDTIQEAEDLLREILALFKAYFLTNESLIEETLMDLRLRVAELGLIDGYDGKEPILELIFPPIKLPEGSPYEKVSHYLNTHASMMAIGWGVILPLGATWARHKKVNKKSRHAFVHAAVQTFGLVFVLIAFIIGFVKLKTDRDDRLVHVHRAMGITIFTLAWFNPFSGFIRLRLDERRTALNFIVARIHTWLIRSAFVLAFVQIPIGMYIVGASYDYTIVYVVLMAVLIAIVLIAELYFSWKEEQRSSTGGTPPGVIEVDDFKIKDSAT